MVFLSDNGLGRSINFFLGNDGPTPCPSPNWGGEKEETGEMLRRVAATSPRTSDFLPLPDTGRGRGDG